MWRRRAACRARCTSALRHCSMPSGPRPYRASATSPALVKDSYGSILAQDDAGGLMRDEPISEDRRAHFSSTTLSWSTARHRSTISPLSFSYISSRCKRHWRNPRMPPTRCRRTSAANSGSNRVPPEPHGLVTDVDAALGQQILDVPQAQRERNVRHHQQHRSPRVRS